MMIPTPQLPTESESTAPSTLTLYQPFLGGLHWDLSGAGIRIVGGEVWLNSSTYVIACLTHNKLRCSLCPSCLNAFLLFHIFQAVVAKRSQSVTPLSSLSFQITSMKSFREWARLGGIISPVSFQTSEAILQFHRMLHFVVWIKSYLSNE